METNELGNRNSFKKSTIRKRYGTDKGNETSNDNLLQLNGKKLNYHLKKKTIKTGKVRMKRITASIQQRIFLYFFKSISSIAEKAELHSAFGNFITYNLQLNKS